MPSAVFLSFFVYLFIFFLYFRGYPAKCKWDVRIFPAWIQHSLTAEHNSAIWKISTANVKFWSQSLRNESSGGFFSGVVILHQCWNHTREERLFLLQTIPITSSTLETTTWRRGYVRQAEGKWTNRRGKKKRLSLGNANPQFFSFLLIVVWRGWIGILLGREVTSTDDWQFSYSLEHHRLRLIGRGARLSELHWLYETRRPPWKPLFRYQNTFLRKLEAKLLHYSETQATIFWGLVIIKIWMKLENSRP